MNNIPINIAIIPKSLLGDSFLSLIIANNLQKNGFQITFYSNHTYSLQKWLPTIIVKPKPNENDIEKICTNHDLIMADGYIISTSFPASQHLDLIKNFVFFYMARSINSNLTADISDYLATKIKDKNKLKKILPLLKANGCTIGTLENHTPIVSRIVRFCTDILKLNNVTEDTGLVAPQQLVYRKYPARIIIHPTSSDTTKRRNWLPRKFIKFAHLLKKQGWYPVFCMSQDEHPEWQKKLGNEFNLPKFSTIDELASFVYESGYMIGNDSGIGHLASCLKIPTLTIINLTNRFYYRPGWGITKTVTPPFRLPKPCRKYWWRYTVSVKRVIKAFNKLVENFP